MDFEPVKKVTSYEMIVDQIEAGVRDGRLSPGDRLPGERGLMETFSVSRATIREAMRVLHATGVVSTRAGDPRGPEVLAFNPQILERPLERMTHEGATRAELIQFRLLLEGQSALLAAAQHNRDTMARISARADDLQTFADRAAETADPAEIPEEFGALLSRFHEAIRAASGNRLLQATGQAVDGALTSLARQRLGEEEDPAAIYSRLHQSARDASTLEARIRGGDSAGARRSATQNIYRFYQEGLTAVEQEALAPLVQ